MVNVSIPLTLGDAADNLRGALDYLAGVLVSEEGNDPVAFKTIFPILEKQPVATNPLHVRGGVSAAALKIIDSVQPYKTPGWLEHPLLVLDHLANIHKHRSVVTGTKEIGDVAFTNPEIPLARYAVTLGEVRDDDAELIFTLTGASGKEETGSAYMWVDHAKNQPVPPIRSLTNAARFIREEVLLPIEQTCL